MKRNRWAAALLTLVIFGLGVAAGALAHRYYTETVVSAKAPEDFRHRYVDELQSRLHLSPAQLTQLEAILDDTKAKFHAIREASRPAMLNVRNEQIARVKAILTPEQVPVYEKLMAERERRFHDQDDHDRHDQQKRGGHPPDPDK